MAKEKQSFFEKISGGKKPILKPEDPVKNNAPVKTENDLNDLRDGQEGQLAVDVYETGSDIVVESIIGGVNSDNINVAVANDVLTIKGVREKSSEAVEGANYFVAECFWGPFSRSIILPCEVDVESIKAAIKKGVLKITLPKLVGSKTKKITIEEA